MVLAALTPASAGAESLVDALQLAYQTNPVLRAQRAQLRADDEEYVQAASGFGPKINLTGQYGYQAARVGEPGSIFSPSTSTDYHAGNGSADLSLTQPLYTSGATSAGVRSAEADILASRETLRETEGELLQGAINAYIDVRRDRQSLAVLKDEIAALTLEAEEIKAKVAAGALSTTDAAQAQSRLLSAKGQLIQTQARLSISTAEYVNVIGQNPGELEPEPALKAVPATVDQAFDAAEHNSPKLLGSEQTERAAHEKANAAKSETGASVSLRLDAAISPTESYLERRYDQYVSVAAVVSKPIFTAGYNRSKIREALEEDNKARLQIDGARRDLIQRVSQSWSQIIATKAAMTLLQGQLEDEEKAVKGYRVEEQAGLRSTIDLLNSELELANDRLSLIQNQHDGYAAQAQLLLAMGLLELRYFAPNAELYSPKKALDRVRMPGLAAMTGPLRWLDGVGAPAPAPTVNSTPNETSKPPSSTVLDGITPPSP